MNKYLVIPVMALLLGLAFSTAGMADREGSKGEGHHMMRGDHDGGHMMHGDFGGHHGMHGDYHGRHDRPSWKASLNDAQKQKLKKMKVDFLKVKYPLKAKMKVAKMELAVLATADASDQKAINAKIDELLALKKELLKAKYAHKVAVRKELKPEQRVAFDKHMLKKAKRGKCKGYHSKKH